MNEELCKHCGGKISIRLPVPKSGCDHLYYPENCLICSAKKPSDMNLLKEEIDRLNILLEEKMKELCLKQEEWHKAGWDDAKEEMEKLKAQNEKYRKALGRIRNIRIDGFDWPLHCEIAEEVLKGE